LLSIWQLRDKETLKAESHVQMAKLIRTMRMVTVVLIVKEREEGNRKDTEWPPKSTKERNTGGHRDGAH
jgi:hypothetical protein